MSVASSRKPRRASRARVLRWLRSAERTPRWLAGTTSGLAALAALGRLEPYLWLGALVGELAFHLALLGLLVAALAFVRRAFVAFAGLVASALTLALPLAPLYQDTSPTPQRGPIVRVAAVHLAGAALPHDALVRLLAEVRPDALALTGLARGTRMAERIGTHRLVRAGGAASSALLVESALLLASRAPARGWPSATLRVGRCSAQVSALSLPKLANYPARRQRAARLHALVDAPSAPRDVWLGELGSRAEAHDLHPFLTQHALRDGRVGHGRLASAPGALGVLGLPLTHVLVHGWIGVREIMTQPAIQPGAQRTLRAVLELTEPHCRPDPQARSE